MTRKPLIEGRSACAPKDKQHKLEDQLQALIQQLTKQAQENVRLRARVSHQESALHLLEHDFKNLSEQNSHQGGRIHGTLALRPCSVGLQAAGQTTAVSVHALPDPSAWDCSWDARVRCMRTIDLVVLHRQWLQEMAMLLPKAQLRGNGSPEQLRLTSLMDRYTWFNENAMMMAPDAWGQRSSFDLETLQPIQRPSLEFFMEVFGRREKNQQTAAHFREYVTASRKLRGEFEVLAAQHSAVLARQDCRAAGTDAAERPRDGRWLRVEVSEGRMQWGDRQMQVPSSGGRTHQGSRLQGLGGSGRTSAGDELLLETDALVIKMERNLWQQRMALRQCLHAVWRDLRLTSSMDVAGAYLTIYPLPLDAVDFLDMIEGGGVRVPPPVAARAAVRGGKEA